MKDLMFYDAMCAVGIPMNGGISYAPNAHALLQEMDYYGVDYALVRHINSASTGAVECNRMIADFVQDDKSKRLSGVWCILPQQCPELPEPDRFFAEMKKKRIAAITLDPLAHRWIACRMTIGKIMDAARERKIPVLLDAFAYHWNELYAFLEEFPDNIYISPDSGKWGADRFVRPLLENYSGFHFMISCYWVPEGIRELAGLYGAERIIYGSNYPVLNHGNMMLPLKNSGLCDADIAKIAGLNLQNLLKGAQL